MNGIVHRSHWSLRLQDVSPEVRRGLWRHALTSLAVSAAVFVGCSALVWWIVG